MTKTGGVPVWRLPCGCMVEHPKGAVRKVWNCSHHAKESRALVLLKDMLGFIRFTVDGGKVEDVTGIIAQTLVHDITGFMDERECFSPRVTGYWDKHLEARKEAMRKESAERKDTRALAHTNVERERRKRERMDELMGFRGEVLLKAALPAVEELEGCEPERAEGLALKRSRPELAELIADRELRRGEL